VLGVLLVLLSLYCLKPFYKTPKMQLLLNPYTSTNNIDSCNILIKSGTGFYAEDPVEVKQLSVYFQTASSKANTTKLFTSKTYRHTVDIACHTDKTQGGIVIWIEERYLGNLTSGGSNFRVQFGTPLRQMCSYDDYFNGTYVIFCPAPVYGCIDVMIDILYVNFYAFRGNQVPLNVRLWNNTLCPLSNGHCSLGHTIPANIVERTALPDVHLLRRRVAAQNQFKWSEVDGKLQLSTYNSQMSNETSSAFQPINQSKFCR